MYDTYRGYCLRKFTNHVEIYDAEAELVDQANSDEEAKALIDWWVTGSIR